MHPLRTPLTASFDTNFKGVYFPVNNGCIESFFVIAGDILTIRVAPTDPVSWNESIEYIIRFEISLASLA